MPVLSALSRLHRNALSLLAMLMLALMLPITAAQAQDTLGELDISGIDVPFTGFVSRTVNVGPGTVDRIFFDFSVQHFGASWGNETRINVIAPNGDRRVFRGDTDFDFGSGAGQFDFTGAIPIGPFDAEGQWTFQFYDSWG